MIGQVPCHIICQVRGRLRVCSCSVVFEPESLDIPLLKFPFRWITSIEPYRQQGWAAEEVAVVITCSQVNQGLHTYCEFDEFGAQF